MKESIYIDVRKEMTTTEGKNMLNIRREISGGDFICLVGHSGSGKTTLLRILSGLLTPDEGVIRVGGKTWFDSTARINLKPQQRSIAYMFQDLALFPNMTVAQNIGYAQRAHNPTHINELLDIFGMKGLATQKPGKLSGGQKQRVALARALASSPQILLLDEPLSSIDQEMREALQSEILKAHEYLNSTSIMVTHDLPEARRMANEIIKIKNGLIVETDETDHTRIR
ncbi:MAG: ATP-binding cassette domain-containing protein [Bacteroides graminisolvens]|jgi:ABC-type sulfate/molybdate transport systems, ATPase component|uniref:Molybdenum transport ATP-binding protein ModC n=3 Tax=root TaxID=1 RepID=A0A069CZ64_9BACE|nr:ATP-binding cassette domain-containing protein [Bacteroides graminisolvens]MEA4886263.1 ATP-binding cassette domain-containing protein [Bacteroides graminisolvens]GAK35356.1 molybdenum transport ATP-binding protein ModC [Bacteroides graminisolvens DSM 19988 = JCM 15093]